MNPTFSLISRPHSKRIRAKLSWFPLINSPHPTQPETTYASTFLRTNAKPVKPIPKSIAVPPPSYTGCAPAADEKEKFAGDPLDGSCVENDQVPGVFVYPAYFSVPVPVTETLAGDPPCEKIDELTKSKV
jgi:hypothetical protein